MDLREEIRAPDMVTERSTSEKKIKTALTAHARHSSQPRAIIIIIEKTINYRTIRDSLTSNIIYIHIYIYMYIDIYIFLCKLRSFVITINYLCHLYHHAFLINYVFSFLFFKAYLKLQRNRNRFTPILIRGYQTNPNN